MKRLFATALLLSTVFILPCTMARQLSDSQMDTKKLNPISQPAPELAIVPFGVGTTFNATLTTPLDAERNKAGDVVTAETAETVTYERSVIFPKGTKIVGHLARASSSRDGKGSALFIRFDKAILKSGEEVLMNAGIQALVAGHGAAVPVEADPIPDEEFVAGSQAARGMHATPGREIATGDSATGPVFILPTSKEVPARTSRASSFVLPSVQGGLNRRGLFTPESQGAFGAPDVKIYTPLSEGSDGTVLLSTRRTVRLENGARLLLVIQPPPDTE
jgi:hypothetical protein